MKELEEFLRRKAKEIKANVFEDDCIVYDESTNNDAIEGDKWLENRTSYIWKVGVLMAWDSNKCDWVNVFIGHKRDVEHECEFIGHLYWQDGENDDIGRSLDRYLKLMRSAHPVFDND